MFQTEGPDANAPFSALNIGSQLGSDLANFLLTDSIIPGSPAGYQMCKTIYSYHPLGAVLTEAPIKRAQGQKRIISLPVLGEERIVKQFEATWDTVGKLGATRIIRNLMAQSRIYGIASIGVGERGKATSEVLDFSKVDDKKLYFNVLDPLNTSGSLILSQDANSPMYLKQGTIFVNGQEWHPSRTLAVMNEDPLFLEWSDSAFGFVGRSVFQRALYPLKSYLRVMITNEWVAQKAGLLVYKGRQTSSVIDNIMLAFAGSKRAQIKAGVVNNVLQIGENEELQSLNLEHLGPAIEVIRKNIIKDIATATGMPSSIIAQETLTEGFGEGTEDAKKEGAYLTEIREMMEPAYSYMDRIVMRLAWTKEFYETLFADYNEYRKVDYETAFYDWQRAFEATWPNVLLEPESEKAKTADVRMKAAIAMIEALAPALDPINKSKVMVWVAELVNEFEELFPAKLDLDEEALMEYLEERRDRENEMAEAGMQEPKPPATFANRA